MLRKDSVSSGGQQYHQYKEHEQLPLSFTHQTHTIKIAVVVRWYMNIRRYDILCTFQ